MNILNLTQHNATQDQLADGVIELSAEHKAFVQTTLTFNTLPSKEELQARAEELASFAAQVRNGLELDEEPVHAMIGGAPYFMSFLEKALKGYGITPVYAFSERQSVDEVQPDGSVVKRAVFKHAGWVTV